jgi:poly-gamma-glutamate biosynthesis protein PgsC/CapC
MIAAALREAGYSVLAKTTGSKAVLILPDGREEEVPRRGLPTILEQKKLAKRASGLHVRAVVSEMMSIRPECLAVESRLLLQPHFLVVTNVRLDHREEMGNTRPEIARSLSSAIGRGAKVFLPVGAQHPEFEHAARRAGADIIHLPNPEVDSFLDEDRRLAAAVAAHLGVAPAAALRGIQAAAPDFGSLKAWEAELGAVSRSWVLVSAFAANEPESTGLILDYLKKKLSPDERSLAGVLNFRADRGDRTLQWLEAHRRGFFAGFRHVTWSALMSTPCACEKRGVRPPPLFHFPRSPPRQSWAGSPRPSEPGVCWSVAEISAAWEGSSSNSGSRSGGPLPFETIFIGLVIALLYTEITGIYPGGLIVPAFLALSLDHPVRAAATIVVACLSMLVYRLLARSFVLFGKRRFVIIVLTASLISQLLALAMPRLLAAPVEFQVIGLVIPVLLANNLERQKFLPTLASLVTVTVMIYFLAELTRMVL